MRRIVFVNRFFYPDISATSQMLSDLAFALGEQGFRIHIVTSRLSYAGPHHELPTREFARGVIIHRIWTSSFGRSSNLGRLLDYLSFYVSSFMSLVLLLRAGDIVVAKTDPPLLSLPVSLACVAKRAKLVNWLQDLFPEVARHLGVTVAQGFFGGLLSGIRDVTLRFGTMNVAIGNVMAGVLSERRIDHRRIAVIPNWADGESIRPVSVSENSLRRAWGLTDKFVIGYSGNLGRAHDFDTILGAAELLRNEPDVVFLFIGAGQAEQRIRAEVAARGLTNVLFRPYQARELLGQSLTLPDVHLVSLVPMLEGYIVPSKFFGAIAAGRPVLFVGSQAGEIAREILRWECGEVVSPGDIECFAHVVRCWMSSPLVVARLGLNARSLFDARFDKPIALKRWAELLEAI